MLSARLKAIADLVEPCEVLADIGSDHGYLPLELLKNGTIQSAVLSELRPKPLASAQSHFLAENLSDQAEFVLSDGLASVTGDLDAIVIAGMGFETIIGIIERDLKRFKAIPQIILQSNTRVEAVRRFMHRNGFNLQAESFVQDRRHSYTVLKYAHQEHTDPLSETELLFGPYLIQSMNPDYRHHLERLLVQLRSIKDVASEELKTKEQLLTQLLQGS